MYMKRIVFIIVSAVILTGCTVGGQITVKTEQTDDKDTVNVLVVRNAGRIIEDNRDYFIGADITEDTNTGSISEFEEKCGAHDVYAEEVYIDEADRAETFILECMAAGKTPYLTVKNRENISESEFREYADSFAEAMGRYGVKVMVEILENSYYYDENGEMFEYLSEKITEAAPQAEKLWSVRYDDVVLADKYMPEDTELVCINGYMSDSAAMLEGLKSFREKDIKAVLRFGVPYYRSSDCTYRADEAAKTIAEVYDAAGKSSDVYGVIYMDKNKRLSDKTLYTDYSVTTDKAMTEKYRQIIENSLSRREEADSDDK